MSTQSILVTGATGFVGRPLCRRLAEHGHRVLAAVRRPETAANLPAEVARVVIGDIGPDTHWDASLFDGVDVVVHLAAHVHVFPEGRHETAAGHHRVNVLGTEALARAAVGRVRRLVYVDSVHAMGTSADGVLDEESPCLPDTPYGESKREAELRLAATAQETGLEVVVVRPTAVYGPGHKGNLMHLFRLIGRGWPVPVATVPNRRSLVFVDNLADALVASLAHPAAAGQTFLVSDGQDVSFGELVRHVAAALERRARIIPLPPALLRAAGVLTGKRGAVRRLLGSLAVDSGKIRRLLGWQPPYSMDQGLARTAQWIGSVS